VRRYRRRRIFTRSQGGGSSAFIHSGHVQPPQLRDFFGGMATIDGCCGFLDQRIGEALAKVRGGKWLIVLTP
jgi:hypothetical protein